MKKMLTCAILLGFSVGPVLGMSGEAMTECVRKAKEGMCSRDVPFFFEGGPVQQRFFLLAHYKYENQEVVNINVRPLLNIRR